MGFDLVGFSEAAPGTGVVGILRGLQDRRYAETTGDDIRIKTEAPYLLGTFYAAESTPDNMRVRQTSRLQDLQFLRAADLNAVTCALNGLDPYFDCPILLRAREMATCIQENATDEDVLVGWFLGPGKFPPRAAPTHIIKAETDQTLTANTWTQCGTLTYDQALPDGLYYIVGMKVGTWITSGDMAALARLILDKTAYRPGVVCDVSGDDKTTMASGAFNQQNYWGLQRDLVFHSKSMPQMELLSPAAMTDHILELAVVAADPADIGNRNPD